MSLADLAAYKARCEAPSEVIPISKGGPNGTNLKPSSYWLLVANAGVAPTTPAVPARTIAGALGQQDPVSIRRLVRASVVPVSVTPTLATLILADRLSHQGGLSGTAVGEQTTNLPTAALTRYTSGVGVYAALEIYSSIGSSGATATIRYTNDQGVGGQVSPEFEFGNGVNQASNSFRIAPLVQGDRGVRSVEGVTLSGSTGTAGNFGVTLFRPLVRIPLLPTGPQDITFLELLCNLASFEAGACLWPLLITGGTAVVPAGIELAFAED